MSVFGGTTVVVLLGMISLLTHKVPCVCAFSLCVCVCWGHGLMVVLVDMQECYLGS